MNEHLEYAKEELKRIDHLIYVTLKYTRTVDVFISIVERMINAYEFIVDALLEHSREQGEVLDTPEIPIAKAEKVLELNKSKKVNEHIEHYLMLRKLRRVPYDKESEFRRHVKMTSVVDGATIEITIDSITEDFQQLKKLVDLVYKQVEND